MNYIIKHAWKIQAAFAVLFLLSITGCTQPAGHTTTGAYSPILVAAEDIENTDIGDKPIDNSVENAAPVAE